MIYSYRKVNITKCFNEGSEDLSNDEMTTKEVSRLIDWLKSKGCSYEEIEQCIDYISKEQPKSTADNKA